jgi:chromosome segregation ATPase
MKKIILSLCAILLLAGCATTTDPSKGGLFSYSPEAYKQRKLEREGRLKELQTEQIAEERRQAALKQTAEQKQAEKANLQQKIQKVNTDSANIKTKLTAYKAQNAAQEAALEDLRGRQTRLQADIQASRAGGGSEESRQIEAERLRREVARLARDAEMLSSL